MASDKLINDSGYERIAWDHYETEPWVTEVLLRYESFSRVWEPAAGKGAILNVMRNRNVDCYGSDILDYGFGFDVADFLLTWGNPDQRDIVTNPPFAEDLADQFIEHSLLLTKPFGGRVAMLLRNEFDCALSRRRIFGKPPFACKIVLLKRPRWIEGTTGSPRHNYAWYIWDWQWNKAPTIIYDK
jgi:hypothetical protein